MECVRTLFSLEYGNLRFHQSPPLQPKLKRYDVRVRVYRSYNSTLVRPVIMSGGRIRSPYEISDLH